ncbi:MAG TPA: chromosomal replication initiator protein DnaA [Desulfosalsimonadaceae bacterium]|nr:chromosomal replication initiator protein DnaA [Desulfosalsimonadaceae bacterium]
MEKIWQSVKASIKESTPTHVYKMWIEPVEFLKASDDGIVLACPNILFKRRVWENFGGLIKSELTRLAGRQLKLLLEVTHNGGDSKANGNGNGKKYKDRTRIPDDIQLDIPAMNCQPRYGRLLRKEFTFDRFVVGENSTFAYNAAVALASQKNKFPPLFLLSQPGMGKSHLSQAVGHKILSAFPNERVMYITAEDFTTDMVNSLRNSSITEFKEKYRNNCDVLLLDDIHFLSGRTRTQDELALSLDYLYDSGKKIIFSSTMPLKDIPKLCEHLKSRLSQSVVSEIQTPDFSTRFKILKYKSDYYGYQFENQVLEYMASELTENVRLLESGLLGVATKSRLLNMDVDLSLAKSVVKNLAITRKAITLGSIKKVVCKEFGITEKEIASNSRKKGVVRPRQIAMYLARRHTKQSIQSIGRSFNRYHATVIYSINNIENEIKVKSEVQKQVERIDKQLLDGKF